MNLPITGCHAAPIWANGGKGSKQSDALWGNGLWVMYKSSGLWVMHATETWSKLRILKYVKPMVQGKSTGREIQRLQVQTTEDHWKFFLSNLKLIKCLKDKIYAFKDIIKFKDMGSEQFYVLKFNVGLWMPRF